MKTFHLKINTESPVLVSGGPPAGNLMETLDYIPGTVLRGLLAHRYVECGGSYDDECFGKLFLKGGAVFDHGRINGAEVIPLSARTCKYHGGFKADAFDSGNHGVTDLILAGSQERRCRDCEEKSPLDYFDGFFRIKTGGNAPEYVRESVRHRLITRTAIDNRFGTAASGQLYTQKTIEAGQSFIARISVSDELADVAENMIQKPFSALIGKGKSRGQGWVEIAQTPGVDMLKSSREPGKQFKSEDGLPLLVVTLLSDAIFQDDYLRDLSLPTIRHITVDGIRVEDWEADPSDAYADTRLVFGFDGKPLNLPAIPRMAIIAGSVFVFRAKNKNPQYPKDRHEVRIGDNIHVGFGRAVLWHPFHLDFKPVEDR